MKVIQVVAVLLFCAAIDAFPSQECLKWCYVELDGHVRFSCCSFTEKAGVCPRNCLFAKPKNVKHIICNSDSDCPGSFKCCQDPCFSRSNICKPVLYQLAPNELKKITTTPPPVPTTTQTTTEEAIPDTEVIEQREVTENQSTAVEEEISNKQEATEAEFTTLTIETYEYETTTIVDPQPEETEEDATTEASENGGEYTEAPESLNESTQIMEERSESTVTEVETTVTTEETRENEDSSGETNEIPEEEEEEEEEEQDEEEEEGETGETDASQEENNDDFWSTKDKDYEENFI